MLNSNEISKDSASLRNLLDDLKDVKDISKSANILCKQIEEYIK